MMTPILKWIFLIPRVANNLLRWTRDFADSESDGKITTQVAQDALSKREVDQSR